MITLYQIQNLKKGDQVLLIPWGSTVQSSCTVVYNGPRLDATGEIVPGMPAILTLQIGEGPMTISWGYDGLNQGLPELSLP